MRRLGSTTKVPGIDAMAEVTIPQYHELMWPTLASAGPTPLRTGFGRASRRLA